MEITFNVIELLRDESGTGLTRIAEEFGHSKSTIHSHLRTFENRKFVVRDGDGYG